MNNKNIYFLKKYIQKFHVFCRIFAKLKLNRKLFIINKITYEKVFVKYFYVFSCILYTVKS